MFKIVKSWGEGTWQYLCPRILVFLKLNCELIIRLSETLKYLYEKHLHYVFYKYSVFFLTWICHGGEQLQSIEIYNLLCSSLQFNYVV